MLPIPPINILSSIVTILLTDETSLINSSMSIGKQKQSKTLSGKFIEFILFAIIP